MTSRTHNGAAIEQRWFQAPAHAEEETLKILAIGLIVLGAATASIPQAQSQTAARPALANEADYLRAMKELSNWGRWGKDDELGAANLITAAICKMTGGQPGNVCTSSGVVTASAHL